MDWSKIKTIFIISFLILNIYLTYQFLLIRDANKYKIISEASLEEKLKTDEIDFVSLPKGMVKDKYLSAKPKEFNKNDIMLIKNQTVNIINGSLLQSVIENPVAINKQFDPLEAQSFLNSNVLFGDQYTYWNLDTDTKTITFYQNFDNKMFYENINGKVTLYLDDDFQIISYDQTYLEGIESLTEKEDILPSIKAIETLYLKGLLKPKSKITKVELGYSTLVQLAASQVLTPTWHLVVEGKEHLYVNAFEGQIIQLGKDETIK